MHKETRLNRSCLHPKSTDPKNEEEALLHFHSSFTVLLFMLGWRAMFQIHQCYFPAFKYTAVWLHHHDAGPLQSPSTQMRRDVRQAGSLM